MLKRTWVLGLFLLAGCAGCAAVETINPQNILEHPFGAGSLTMGMTKQEVELKWGKPDAVNQVTDPARWKGAREEWVYRAKMDTVPVDAGYISKAKRLYFDGDNLTDFQE